MRMTEKKTRATLLAAALASMAVFSSSEGAARADEREQCASAADQAQQLRDEGKYRREREALLTCVRDVCPGPIKRDCLDWLSQLETIAPTVVFSAKEGTKDLSEVKVSVDNVPVADKLDGKPLQMDLGKHTFKFEYAGQTKEEELVIGAGQKNRSVGVTFGGAPPPPPITPPPPETSSGSIVPAAIVGGVGVLALGSFAIFGLTGKSDVDDLESCRGHCAESDVDHARTKLIIADISLGVGIVALGVATYMFFTRPKEGSGAVPVKAAVARTPSKPFGWSSVAFDAGPTPGACGAVGGIRAHF